MGEQARHHLALDLIEKFLRKGLKPALISRGYGGTAKNITEVFEFSDVRAVGDEALLIKAKSKIPVFIGKIGKMLQKFYLKNIPNIHNYF